MSPLFSSFSLGDLELKNRIVMPALTRRRCDPADGIPNDLLLEYYLQRASAGLIITETTAISRQGNPWSGTACLYDNAHAAGWRRITDALHDVGTPVFVQLAHGGRACDAAFTGMPLLAPSALPMMEYDQTATQLQVKTTPQAMDEDLIRAVIAEFMHAARLAAAAGFDGIELQGGNGYLIDQFLRSESNHRSDAYGGSIENRCRFCLEVVDAILEIWPAHRVGIKLTPVGRFNYMCDEDPKATFSHLLARLDERGLGFVQIPEAENIFGPPLFVDQRAQVEHCARTFRPLFRGGYVANQGLSPEMGARMVEVGEADLIAFGKLWITNPDLVCRLRNGWELHRQIDYGLIFSGGRKGYTDFPRHPSNTVPA
jgi:N-ethylmaleimide reductase